MASIVWYRRLADMPEVEYAPHQGFRARRLEEQAEKPTGKVHGIVTWPGGTSASPAHRRAFGTPWQELASSELVEQLATALDVPGLPGDYYFAIMQATDELWRRRKTDVWVCSHLEYLFQAQIGILRARPPDLRFGHDFRETRCFPHLTQLLIERDRVEDAMEVAIAGQHFGEGSALVDQVKKREAKRKA